MRVERDHSGPSRRLRARVCGCACGEHKATRCPRDSFSCVPPACKARHHASPPAPSARETVSLGMSTHDQRMTPRRECRGEGEAAGGEARGREETETQRRDKRARTTQPEKKCPHNQRKSQCVDYITICLQSDVFQTVPWVLAYAVAASMLRGWQPLQEAQGSIERSTCKECGGASIFPHDRQRSKCNGCGGACICTTAERGARAVSECKHRSSDARLRLSPLAWSCDRMLGVHEHAPHDTLRTGTRGSRGRHRRSHLRPRSTHTPALL